MKFGIEAASFYLPALCMEINALAKVRNLDLDKLQLGLGIKKMSLPDRHEDTATMGAEALLKLIQDYKIDPQSIGRIYLGTESALDASKPTATYIASMVEEKLKSKFSERCFQNCDVADITFACIGGVDAMQCCLEYVQLNPHKKAIAIAADHAKYQLHSTGEYTQGAGAVALLISAKPNLLEINNQWGVATQSVFDFFKPRRQTLKTQILNAEETAPDEMEIFTDEPVFDGQYSNECYKARIDEAYEDFKKKNSLPTKAYENWRFIAFHLPYAHHAKRIFVDIYCKENGLNFSDEEERKIISKSVEYKSVVAQKIEPTQRASSQVGNLYTASIFMAMISALQASLDEGEDLSRQSMGFFAYGSGSKAKVFSAKINENWKSVAQKWNLFEVLEKRRNVDFKTYEGLHRRRLSASVIADYKGFGLLDIEREDATKYGARKYIFRE